MRPPAELLFEGIGRSLSALAAAADPDLPDLLAESEGRRLALVVRGTERVLEIEVRDGALRVLAPRRIAPGGLGSVAGREAGGSASAAADGAREGDAPGAGGDEPGAGGDEPTARTPHERGGPARDRAAPEAPRADGGETGGAGGAPSDADLTLIGSVPDFLRLLRDIRREPPPDDPFEPIEALGTPEARAGFVQLLRRIDPDPEALLARAVGGVVAHALSRTTLGRLNLARKSAARLVDDLSEYLEEEARLTPDRASRARFAADVRALVAKVEELEERVERAAAARQRG